MKTYLERKRKKHVSLWEKIRFDLHKMISEQCEDAVIGEDHHDVDMVVNIFMEFALALEVISQACVNAASQIVDLDMHDQMLEMIKEDKEFINAYKKCMGQSMARKYITPIEHVKFMMKEGEA